MILTAKISIFQHIYICILYFESYTYNNNVGIFHAIIEDFTLNTCIRTFPPFRPKTYQHNIVKYVILSIIFFTL
jgi:hypothetical protein